MPFNGLLFLLLLFAISNNPVYSSVKGSSKLIIEKKKWEENVKEVDFTENFKKREQKRSEYKMPFNFNLSGLKYVFLLIIIITLLFFLIRVIDKNAGLYTKIRKNASYSINNLDENLFEADLTGLLEASLQSGNYNQAIRIHFLMIIKILSSNNYINWKKDKTNGDYLNEFRENLRYLTFKHLALIYERIWYGEYQINKSDYDNISKGFISFYTIFSENNKEQNSNSLAINH